MADTVLAVLVGATASVVTTVATLWLGPLLNRRNPYDKQFDDNARALLTECLNKDRGPQDLKILMNVTGFSDKRTKNYLMQIGARGSEHDDGKWWTMANDNPISTKVPN